MNIDVHCQGNLGQKYLPLLWYDRIHALKIILTMFVLVAPVRAYSGYQGVIFIISQCPKLTPTTLPKFMYT